MMTATTGLIVLAIAFLVPSAQETDPVLLRWKLPEGKALGFKASLQQLGAAPPEFDFDFLSKVVGTGEVPKEAKEKVQNFFEGIKPPKDYSVSLILKAKEEGRIAVLLVADKIPVFETPDPKMTEIFNKLQEKVQLRGEIDSAGGVESFWLATPQKNLVSLFTELPKNRVKVGDHWSLTVNLVQMGHGFIAEKSSRVNRVDFSSIEKGSDGELVAVLNYVVGESVLGSFHLGDQAKPTTMMIAFVARARFSITKGAWKSFSGRMATKATGILSTNSIQELGLDPLPTVPEDLLKLK